MEMFCELHYGVTGKTIPQELSILGCVMPGRTTKVLFNIAHNTFVGSLQVRQTQCNFIRSDYFHEHVTQKVVQAKQFLGCVFHETRIS